MTGVVGITVDNRLRMERSWLEQLSPGLTDDLRDQFAHPNPVHGKIVGMGYRPPVTEPAIINTWQLFGDELSLPRGGMERVREVLRRRALRWSVVDKRVTGSMNKPSSYPHGLCAINLRPEQEQLLAAAMKRENCILHSPTGSGKTCVMLELIRRANLPALVVLWNVALLEQWRQRIAEHLGVTSVGIIRGQKFDLQPITLAMQQTLWNLDAPQWATLRNAFGVVVLEEAQRASARTYVDVVDKFPAKYRIAISDSTKRKDGKHFLTHDLFGDVAMQVDNDALVAAGSVLDVEVRMVETDFTADWYRRAMHKDANKYARGRAHARLMGQMTRDVKRNERIVQVMGLALSKESSRVLVFSNRVEHCQLLHKVFESCSWKSGLLLGSSESKAAQHLFADNAAKLGRGDLRVGVGTVGAIGAGIDIPEVDRGVITTLGSNSNKQLWRQIQGRMCRPAPGKTDAVAYVLWDAAVFGGSPLRNMLKWSKRVRVLTLDGTLVDGEKYLEGKPDDEAQPDFLDTHELDAVEQSLEQIVQRFG